MTTSKVTKITTNNLQHTPPPMHHHPCTTTHAQNSVPNSTMHHPCTAQPACHTTTTLMPPRQYTSELHDIAAIAFAHLFMYRYPSQPVSECDANQKSQLGSGYFMLFNVNNYEVDPLLKDKISSR